ncbi:hypothetical protein [Shewanella waksmanii]|uniref:hypothetical protein n=1 Tax=Shewanella waksmanii TaxID=213783 RepID=UPI0037364DD3
MRHFCVSKLLILIIAIGLPIQLSAGQVVVRKSSEPFDAFAVRDQVQQLHEWQEALRYQQQIQILQALPVGCILMPIHYFRCGQRYYRPYHYQQQDVYIQVDPPKSHQQQTPKP